jgi:hypothetical protein
MSFVVTDEIRARIRADIATWPPLTPAQIAFIVDAFGGPPEATPICSTPLAVGGAPGELTARNATT